MNFSFELKRQIHISFLDYHLNFILFLKIVQYILKKIILPNKLSAHRIFIPGQSLSALQN